MTHDRTLTLGDGATLAWTERDAARPDAPVILWLHAFPLSRAMWAPQLERLDGATRHLAPDHRGFGASTLGSAPASMDRYADDAVALLDRVGVRRAVVVGLSMGGYVALALWRRHRERVAGLVLADTRAEADTDEARERRRALIDLARREGSAAVAEQQLPSMLGRTTRETRPDVVASLRAMMASAPVDGIVAALEAMMARPDSTALLATIDVPTLLVAGEEDAITQPKEMRAMAERIPGARLVELPRAGHASNVEQPERFADAVASLLSPA
jgi:3-oxoadipate enol-lactonase